MFNRIILIGRLTRDPEAKYTPSGVPVTSFSIAVDRPQSSEARQQGREKETDFIDIVAWRQTAEFAANYLQKGRMVVVEGKLQIRSFVTQTVSSAKPLRLSPTTCERWIVPVRAVKARARRAAAVVADSAQADPQAAVTATPAAVPVLAADTAAGMVAEAETPRHRDRPRRRPTVRLRANPRRIHRGFLRRHGRSCRSVRGITRTLRRSIALPT